METAIDECIKEHILEDFFLAKKDEVMKVTHLDYTWEKREQMIYKDGVEDSRNETIQTMLAEGIDVAIILKSGFTMEEIEKAGGQK